MAGGLMQLVAYGAQDVYLTGNPQITFWKVTYRRHTNFAMESIEQTFNGQADFGRRVQCTISRNGDLAYRTYLQVTLPEVSASDGARNSNANSGAGDAQHRWYDYPGEQLISTVEVEIGGQRIDRQFGDWMHIWNSLTMTSEQEAGYKAMVGHTTQLTYLTDAAAHAVNSPCKDAAPAQVCAPRNALPATTLYIPLQFWFCRNPGLALPLIALQYHEVRITLDLRPLEECLFSVRPNLNGDANEYVPVSKSLESASLFVDYIFLDTDERRRMAQNPHEYLIEQLQFTGDESVGSTSNRIKLNFNHPVKELVWVVQRDSLVDKCNAQDLHLDYGCQYFNYTDAVDILPPDNAAFRASSASAVEGGDTVEVSDDGFVVNDAAQGVFATNTAAVTDVNDDKIDVLVPPTATSQASLVSDGGAFVLAETALDMHCWGQNPVVTARLQLNGQDRFAEREGSYFDLVQPYQHHTRTPSTGINVYSFALRPEEHQPSGTCNFSRIDNATLQMTLSHDTVGDAETAKVRVYAVNYNVLRIMSGMGGLAYSN